MGPLSRPLHFGPALGFLDELSIVILYRGVPLAWPEGTSCYWSIRHVSALLDINVQPVEASFVFAVELHDKLDKRAFSKLSSSTDPHRVPLLQRIFDE